MKSCLTCEYVDDINRNDRDLRHCYQCKVRFVALDGKMVYQLMHYEEASEEKRIARRDW